MIHVQDCEFYETFWPMILNSIPLDGHSVPDSSIPQFKVKGVYIGMQTVCKVMLLTSVDFRNWELACATTK